MLGGIVDQLRMGRGMAGTALIEQYDAIDIGIKEAAVKGLTASAGAVPLVDIDRTKGPRFTMEPKVKLQ